MLDLASPVKTQTRASPPVRVLHIIERLRRGGPANALMGVAKYSRQANGHQHKVVSLLPPDPFACKLAVEADLQVVGVLNAISLRRELAEADIVQLHFWNSAELHALIESDLPAMRTLAWCHVNGETAPQILPRALFSLAEVVVATTASTLELPSFRTADPNRVEVIPGGADFSRLVGMTPIAHSGFNVGYIGRIDFVKLHADFIRMCGTVDVPGVCFHVCGDGGSGRELERQARDLGLQSRFSFSGYAKDIRPIASILDVFGYPLCKGNSTTAELILQEVMYLGIPPVVLPYGGAARMLIDGHSGIVARDENDYVRAIEWLYHNPLERMRLGRNAARQAREQFGAHKSAQCFDAIYSRLMQQPKSLRRNTATSSKSSQSSAGASALIRSLDGIGDGDFVASITASNDIDAGAAEDRIARASPTMSDIVLQYRMHYPDDAFLRLWTGLILAQRGRTALAASEFKTSITRGCRHPRIYRYFARCAQDAGAPAIARHALGVIGEGGFYKMSEANDSKGE